MRDCVFAPHAPTASKTHLEVIVRVLLRVGIEHRQVLPFRPLLPGSNSKKRCHLATLARSRDLCWGAGELRAEDGGVLR